MEPNNSLDLVQAGVLGVVLLAMLTGWIWAKPAVEDLQKRIKALEAELLWWRDKLLPALEEIQRLLREFKERERDKG